MSHWIPVSTGMGWGRLREHRHRTTPAKAGVQSDTVSPKGRLVVSLDSRFHGNGVGSTPVNTATIPLPRKWESSRILCRPKGDPLFHWIPVSTGMGWGRLREHRHRTTPAKAGVQSDTVSPKGRLVVSLDSRFHGNGMGGASVNPATVPLPRKRESSQILCRPKGDSLSHWIPVSTGMGCGALPLTPPPYHSHESGSPVEYCVAQRATLCFTGFPFAREWYCQGRCLSQLLMATGKVSLAPAPT